MKINLKPHPKIIGSNWKELDSFITESKEEFPDLGLWKKVENIQPSVEKIKELKDKGWVATQVPQEELIRNIGYESKTIIGFCSFKEKKLLVKKQMPIYERDKTLCHEIVHALYHDLIYE